MRYLRRHQGHQPCTYVGINSITLNVAENIVQTLSFPCGSYAFFGCYEKHFLDGLSDMIGQHARRHGEVVQPDEGIRFHRAEG